MYLRKINLQLFAENNIMTTDAGTEASHAGLSGTMKTYWDTELLDNAQPLLVHHQFGMKVNVPQNHGRTVEWRKWSSFDKSLTPLVDGVTPNAQRFSVSTITEVLYQYGAYSTISDYLDLTSIDDVLLEAANRHGEAAGLTLDTLTRNAIHSGVEQILYAYTDTVVPTTRSSLTVECRLTPTIVAKAVAMLKKKNAPKIDGSYVAIIHPSVEFDLQTDENWINVHKYAATKEIFEGEIGELYGVRFVVTSEAKIWRDAATGAGKTPENTAVYGCLFLGKDAYGVVNLEGGGLEMIMKQKGSAGTADPLNQRSTVGWKVSGYAAKVLHPEYIVRVEACSDFSTTDEAN